MHVPRLDNENWGLMLNKPMCYPSPLLLSGRLSHLWRGVSHLWPAGLRPAWPAGLLPAYTHRIRAGLCYTWLRVAVPVSKVVRFCPGWRVVHSIVFPLWRISYDLTQKIIHWPHNTGMMVTWLRKQSTSQKGQSLPLLWWLVAQTAVSLWFSSPALVPCLLDFLPMLVQSPTSPGEKREAL